MKAPEHGPIGWMARNRVAANLVMITIIAAGILFSLRAKQEVFPEFELDLVQVTVPYPGASPEEVESGIVLAVEEAVRGVDGVKRVVSSAVEGQARIQAELEFGTDADRANADIKNAVDRITSFPEDSERPVVSLATNRTEVISLIVHGRVAERTLRDVAEKARDDLLQLPAITQVEISGTPPPEISIEVSSRTLNAHGLTLESIARTVGRAALELPGGGIKTPGGEVLVRLAERRDVAADFASIPVVAGRNGAFLSLGELATVQEGFAETEESAYFNGEPAVRVDVYRVGSETPTEVAAAVRDYVASATGQTPPGVQLTTWQDRSEVLEDRIDLLLRNAMLGLFLVLLILGFFLEVRLAFWVTLGIPISFLGGLLLMPALDVSLNMISLFAFIVTLGIVVDDAIIVGENVFEHRRRGKSALRAAVDGTREMAGPVTFAVLTTIAAFSPMLFVPGVSGKIFRVIPSVVIAVLVVSLVEAMFILPAHLGHLRKNDERRGMLGRLLGAKRGVVHRWLQWWMELTYRPSLAAVVRRRYLTLASGVAILVITIALAASGRIAFTFLPKIEADRVTASLALPVGSPLERTLAVQDHLVRSAREVVGQMQAGRTVRGIYSQVGRPIVRGGPAGAGSSTTGGHLADVEIALVSANQRSFTAAELARRWRQQVGVLPGIDRLVFQFSTGPSAGAPIDVELRHPDPQLLEEAARELARSLADYQGVIDIDDGVNRGKQQIDLQLLPAGRSLGLTPSALGRQVRHAFYGAEALRQQRGREEMRVMVRLPRRERETEHTLEQMLLHTPRGDQVSFGQVAKVIRGRSYTEIRRADGRRVANVTADVDRGLANAGQVLGALRSDVLPELTRRHPDLGYAFEGEQRSQREALGSLGIGFAVALLIIFGLIAVPFRSYVQPVIVLSAIPFGFVGAVIGHLLMGFDLSLISMFGIVALAGVVVNDSLILVHTANALRRDEGLTAAEAVQQAGLRRFRPIMLTSLTTFFGLAPMIFETSVQARFLVPMAISLGYGILFATFIVLVLVPALYMIVEDVRGITGTTRRPVGEAVPEEN